MFKVNLFLKLPNKKKKSNKKITFLSLINNIHVFFYRKEEDLKMKHFYIKLTIHHLFYKIFKIKIFNIVCIRYAYNKKKKINFFSKLSNGC